MDLINKLSRPQSYSPTSQQVAPLNSNQSNHTNLNPDVAIKAIEAIEKIKELLTKLEEQFKGQINKQDKNLENTKEGEEKHNNNSLDKVVKKLSNSGVKPSNNNSNNNSNINNNSNNNNGLQKQ